jgi:hypothetical protein
MKQTTSCDGNLPERKTDAGNRGNYHCLVYFISTAGAPEKGQVSSGT